MQLLDVPPEIFQRIVAKYVAKVGLCEAWKHRDVCRTFNSYITEEVFGRQPMKVYYRKSSGRLLKRGLAVYLELRSNALYGAQDIVPTMIRKIAERFMKIRGPSATEKSAEITSQVAAVFVKHCTMTYNLVTKPSDYAKSRFGQDAELDIALCVAIFWDDLDSIKMLLSQGASMWACTNSLGNPLELAVRTRHEVIVQVLLQTAQGKQNLHPTHFFSKIIVDAISASWSKDDQNMVIALIEWHAKKLGRPQDSFCIILFHQAKSSGSTKSFEALLNLGASNRLASQYRRDFLSYVGPWHKASILLRLLLKKGILNTKELYKYKIRQQSTSQSLLEFAVRQENSVMVRAVLKAGADPNGVELDGRLEYPLRRAIKSNQTSIVQLLLNYGADPEAGDFRHDENTLDIAQQGSQIYGIIHQAIEDKIARLGDEYRPPKR